MKRLKATAEIKTRLEFDRLIDDTVTLQLIKEGRELERDEQLLAVRDLFDPEISDLDEAIQNNVLRAEKYALDHRDELLPTKLKSAETSFAFFGFRIGNPTLVLLNRKWTWAQVIAQLKLLFDGQFLLVKTSVDKDGMKARLTPEQLVSVGTRIEQKETFFIDPKRDPADSQRLVAPAANVKEAA
jgi:phage host-nuclease inhibitor protein Gam